MSATNLYKWSLQSVIQYFIHPSNAVHFQRLKMADLA